MARLSWIVLPGHPVHLIQRRNNRQACFLAEADRLFYLECLADAAGRYGCLIHAYGWRANHIHLLVTPETERTVSSMMQAGGRSYVRHVDATYRRSGTLWEGRYKSALIDSERYLLVCSRYMEHNPVRAGMVERSGEYRWSSYARNCMGWPDETKGAKCLNDTVKPSATPIHCRRT